LYLFHGNHALHFRYCTNRLLGPNCRVMYHCHSPLFFFKETGIAYMDI
jgi:hypothetical protein